MLKKNVAGYVPPAGVDDSLTDGPDVVFVDPSETNAKFTNRTDAGALGAARSSGFNSFTDSQYISHSDSVVGSSDDDLSAYEKAKSLMSEYPDWLALLDQNPYTGFTAPESIWDELGLSNRAKDKLSAMRAAYRQYISDVVLKFMAWRNSLPSEQRSQLVQAGYNPDTIDVQPSVVSDESIKPSSNPFDIASDSTGEQLMSTYNTVLSSIAAGVNGASSIISLVQGVRTATVTRDKIKADTDAQNLKNFRDAYDIAKMIYGESSEPVTSEDGEIAPSFKFDINGAPESVTRILNQFQHSRGFAIAQKSNVVESKNVDTSGKLADVASTVADTSSVVAQSNKISADMKLQQDKLLFGSPEVWKNLEVLYHRALTKQLENIDSYLELFNPMLAASAQNKLNSYLSQYYGALDPTSAASVQNAYMSNFRKLLEYNSEVLRQKRMALEIAGQAATERFAWATLPDNPFTNPLRTYGQISLLGGQMSLDMLGTFQLESGSGSVSSGASSVVPMPNLQLPSLQPK